LKRFLRALRTASRAWVKSRPAKVAALRHDLTRDSLARLAAASGAALGGIPPADVPPPAAGRRPPRRVLRPPRPPRHVAWRPRERRRRPHGRPDPGSRWSREDRSRLGRPGLL